MSLFVSHAQMTPDDILAASYSALALVRVAAAVTRSRPEDEGLADDVGRMLDLAQEFIGVVHDTVERNARHLAVSRGTTTVTR
jgi:hypothetical protein